ncbi:MAG: aldolase/citrate lyase family protein [Campylobacterales bacterium]|nr:aldolase/citrate lyase family protein [Campylobacterales bacterium]
MKTIQIDNLNSVSLAFENRDLEALRKLAVPTQRTINKSSDFSSVLMLSCNNIKHLSKIDSLESECIVLNLEDGVFQEDKPFALFLCAIFLSQHKQSNKKLVVRVNALDEGGYEEICYLNQFMPDAIRVPKIKNRDEVTSVLECLNSNIELHLSIETASAWQNMNSLAVNGRVTTFYLGILDLFADMKLPQSLIKRDNPTMLYILSHFLVTCKSLGIKAVSFVYQEFQNLEEFGMWLSLEKRMGYDAKGCISPKQVALVNEIFSQTQEEITRAKKIVELFECNREQGISGFVDEEYGFIDEPIYKGALHLLEKN